MKQSDRIQQLREQSIHAVEHITAERAQLITQFYKANSQKGLPTPILRAKAFEYILANKEICINANELIVGERGPLPKATPTYPEINLHTVTDLEVLDTREKVFFKVSDRVKQIYKEEIIPFWNEKSNRDAIMQSMDSDWHSAYAAGIFTEFQEQRAPGHTVLGKKLFENGFDVIIAEIDESIASFNSSNDKGAHEKIEELKAMKISAEAIVMYAKRHSEKLIELVEKEKDVNRQNELIEMARICAKVPHSAPETVHEMLQHYWFIHLGVITELNPWDSFNPGRLDQHLLSVYESDLLEGKSKDEIIELLQAFWIKFNNHPAPPKVGVTALESNTYTDFCLINIGGLTPDGSDAVNEVSYMLLDVIEEMRLLQPSSMVQISHKNPDEFIHRALKITKTGFGQPSIFNTDAIIKQLLWQGKSIVDARNGGASGCVETGAFGTESYVLTGYFNLVKVLEVTLNNGLNPKSGKRIGIETGDVWSFKTFDEFMDAFDKQLNYFIAIKLKGNNTIASIWKNNLPAPFLSTLIDGCVSSGTDYNAGGAKYNTSYVQGVGLGTITDSLTAIKKYIYIDKTIGFKEFVDALNKNFESYDELRYQLIYETPKYGNDNDIVDEHAVRVFSAFLNSVNGRPTVNGGVFRVNMLPTTCHVYFGQVTGATPDGRLSGEATSEGISPVQGADMNGPTSVLKSAAKINHIHTGGTLLNQKFAPSYFDGEKAFDNLTALIRAYFKMDGHHIQFNVVDVETLKKAQENPEKYKDLIVRVAGYSDYFNHLGEDLQNEIIKRTEHQ